MNLSNHTLSPCFLNLRTLVNLVFNYLRTSFTCSTSHPAHQTFPRCFPQVLGRDPRRYEAESPSPTLSCLLSPITSSSAEQCSPWAPSALHALTSLASTPARTLKSSQPGSHKHLCICPTNMGAGPQQAGESSLTVFSPLALQGPAIQNLCTSSSPPGSRSLLLSSSL